jgi:hypothetical protein
MAGRNGAPTMPDESTARVALATCARVPDLDQDTKTLLFPLARIGIDVRAAVWSDCRVDWGQYDLTVVRSCWDYHENRDRFLAWARAVDHLANPADVLAWNTDKHYLTELTGHGIPVVPTKPVVRAVGRTAHSPPTTARLAQAIAARVAACRPTTSPESSVTMARPGPRGKS